MSQKMKRETKKHTDYSIEKVLNVKKIKQTLYISSRLPYCKRDWLIHYGCDALALRLSFHKVFIESNCGWA